MVINADGKFLDRFVAALIPTAIGLGLATVLWWADSRAADQRFTEEISRLTRKIDSVETEAREQRQAAAADRQKTAELAGDVRNVLRSTARIESLLDRLVIMPAGPARTERN